MCSSNYPNMQPLAGKSITQRLRDSTDLSFRASPSNSVKPDQSVATKASETHAAVAANERAFPIFAKKLASKDPREYANTARKLTTWLASEKAYYPGARPRIVELLEIALSTFRNTFVNHPSVADLAQLLRELVRAVAPFVHLFSEVELHSKVQQVTIETEQSLSRVTASTTQVNVLPQGTTTSNFTATSTTPLPFPFLSSTNPQSQLAIPPALGPQLSFPHAQRPMDTAKAVSNHPSRTHAPRAHNPAEEVASQSHANMPMTSSALRPQQLGGNVPPSLPPKPQPTRTRAAKLSEELIARDLDWFESNQPPAIVSMDPSLPVVRADESVRIVPSHPLPYRISSEASEGAGSPVESPLVPESLGGKARSPQTEVGSTPNADVQQPFSEMAERAATIPETLLAQKATLHEGSSKSSSNEPSMRSELPQDDSQTKYLQTPAPLDESIGSRDPSIPLHHTTSDRIDSMDISVSDFKQVVSESPQKAESFSPQPSQVVPLQSPLLPPLVGAREPPLNLDFKIPHISPPALAMDANQRRFEEHISIFYVMHLKTSTHASMIDFKLTEDMFTPILKWINRKIAPSEALRGVCISLACYSLAEVGSKIKLENISDLRELASHFPCSWPHTNRLSLHVVCDTKQTIIPLSPPFFLTPNQTVDVTSLLKLGCNMLEIKQQGDLSEYLIILFAHRPSRQQLAEVGVVKAMDERWNLFLDVISARDTHWQGKAPGTIVADVLGAL